MEFIAIGTVALLASLLTFFSGFGLGTLLTPVFALFFPIEVAIAGTGVVHLLNNLFKVSLVGRSIDWKVVLKFGLPGMIGAAGGAWLLIQLTGLDTIYEGEILGTPLRVEPVNLIIGLVLIVFSLRDLLVKNVSGIDQKWLPLGGVISGFFGGISGHQGALRTAFLVQLKLDKTVFIASGIAIACIIDVTRLPIYFRRLDGLDEIPIALFAVAVGMAFIGAFLGKRFLQKITIEILHQIVAYSILVIAVLLIAGIV